MFRRVAALLAALYLVACGTLPPVGSDQPASTDFGRGTMDIYEPHPANDLGIVVVAVHGCCGDRRDLAGLGRALAARGVTVANADVSALADGGGWPATYSDVVCAFSSGRALADERDAALVLLGWGDGALVATSVTLGWDHHRASASGCSVAVPRDGPDTVVGLGGHYGWFGAVPAVRVTAATVDWFGATPDEDPVAWTRGNPGWWVGQNARLGEVALVLIAGPDDATGDFAAGLTRQGYTTELLRIAGALHSDMVQPRGDAGSKVLDVLVVALQSTTDN